MNAPQSWWFVRAPGRGVDAEQNRLLRAINRHQRRDAMADVPSSVNPLTKGFLGKEMYLVVTRPVRSPEIDERLAEHLAHQVELEKRGIMFAAGPLYPRDSETPEAGMFVLRAGSFAEAEEIANEDPLHKAGLRTFTLQKWRVNEGRLTITVHFSDQTMMLE
jgi:uncharacterized protein YciI